MSKRQFENIEEHIRKAAENFSPPVNEEAWQKMEILLDKEFAEKRRRPHTWLWLLLLIVVGVYMLYVRLTGLDPNSRDAAAVNPAKEVQHDHQ